MDLSIIIVNWNVRDLVEKCLKSIFEQTQNINFEIFVVDNGSSDGSVEMMEEKFKEEITSKKLIVIDTKKNLGFAKGNNLPLRDTRGEFILFMNPDMELKENALGKMINFMRSHPDVGISTCALFYPDGEQQKNIKNFPTLWSQIFILLKLHHLFFWFPPVSKYLARDFDYSREQEVNQVMGAFVFARGDLIKRMEGWNEDYWLWWEDVDLCKRAHGLGQKIIYTPVVRVIHYEGKSFEQIASLAKQKRFIKGMLIYFKKHKPYYQYLFLKLFTPFSLFLAWLVQLLKIKPRPQSKV